MAGSLDDMLGGDDKTTPLANITEQDPDKGSDDEFEMHAKTFLDDSNDEETRLEALRMAIQAVVGAS